MAMTDDPEKFAKKYQEFARCTIVGKKHRWIEKTPKHVRRIEKILEWVPNAKIIVITRDGRDVAQSLRERSGTLEDGIERWIGDNEEAIKFRHNPSVCFVKYESIIDNFETSIKEIMFFIGEKYEAAMAEFHATERKWYSGKIERPSSASGRDHERNRNWQINQPLFDGRGKWRKLSHEELRFVNGRAEKTLEKLGYQVE